MSKRTDAERTRSALTGKLRDLAGEKLTQQQSKDIKWYDRRESERIAELTLAALPKGIYCKLAGRQHVVIDKMARNYRIDALLGDTIDLYDAILALHDLIAENARLIQPLRSGTDNRDDGDNGQLDEHDDNVYELQIAKLKETVRKLEIANQRAEIGLQKDRGDAIDRSEFRRMLEYLTVRLQGFGQQLRRSKGGDEAQKSLNEFLDHLSAEIREGELKF